MSEDVQRSVGPFHTLMDQDLKDSSS